MSLTAQSAQGEEREQEQGQRFEGLVSEKKPAPPLPRPAALYVATTLEFWVAKDGHHYAPDVGIYGVAYRRLDPEYFAWLASRMTLAQRAAKTGKMSGAQLGDLSRKFAAIERWAKTHFLKQELDQAARALDTKTYAPPSIEGLGIGSRPRSRPTDPFGSFVAPLGRSRIDSDEASPPHGHLYPTEGEWRHTQRVTSEALDRVKNSEDEEDHAVHHVGAVADIETEGLRRPKTALCGVAR